MTETIRTEVLIAGAGPAGLVTAAILSWFGVDSVLLEKHPGTSIYPRANVFSTRTMEIFRSMGLEETVRATSFDLGEGIVVGPALLAPELTVVPMGFPSRDEALMVSPTWPAGGAQDLLEPVLLEHARGLGADVRFSTELQDFELGDGGVTARAVNCTTGEALRIHAGYLVGCDGTRSRVRELAGIAFDGEARAGRWSTVLFRSAIRDRVDLPPAPLYVIDSFERETIFVPTDADDRWTFATRLADEDDEPLDPSDHDALRAVIRQAAGIDDLAIEVLDSRTFYLGAQVARRFRLGNLFLAGDAAHRMTPSGGMGLNTAIHDAHNLAWKLAYVLSGWAGEALLDSYEPERRPIGERNVRRSIGEETERRPDGLDVDPGYSYRSAAVVTEAWSPETDGQSLLTGEPGTRLPHFWVQREEGLVSSLDLVAGRYVLLAGAGSGGWREAAAVVTRELPVPLEFRELEAGFTPSGVEWRRACGIDDGGAVLVRPDGFVAWRSRPGLQDAESILRRVLVQSLALEADATLVLV